MYRKFCYFSPKKNYSLKIDGEIYVAFSKYSYWVRRDFSIETWRFSEENLPATPQWKGVKICTFLLRILMTLFPFFAKYFLEKKSNFLFKITLGKCTMGNAFLFYCYGDDVLVPENEWMNEDWEILVESFLLWIFGSFPDFLAIFAKNEAFWGILRYFEVSCKFL